MGKGDKYNFKTGDITKADGTIIKRDGTVIRPDGTTVPPDAEPETSTSNNQASGSDEYTGRSIDLSDEEWLNVSDDDIFDWAESNEELEYARAQREAAKKRVEQQRQTQQSQNTVNADTTNTTTRSGKVTGGDLKNAKKKLKGVTGEQLKDSSKRTIKKNNLKGKTFNVKGGSIKQIIANTIINETVEQVATETVNNMLHPNMFNSLDQFADMSDDDIKYFADMIENEDLRKQRTNEWKKKREEARNNRKKTAKEEKLKETEEKINNIYEQFKTGEYKQQIPIHEKNKLEGIEFEVDENGKTVIKKKKLLDGLGSADGDDIFGWMKKHGVGIAEAINVLSTIGSYKDARKEGKGVVSSIASAAGTFVKGELLGFWGGLGWEVAKGIPKLAIKGAETLYKENRKMNAAANQQTFGDAQFHDTQQLATMRQSGMEMAKMAQYNLQQTLMGNEATHLHR